MQSKCYRRCFLLGRNGKMSNGHFTISSWMELDLSSQRETPIQKEIVKGKSKRSNTA